MGHEKCVNCIVHSLVELGCSSCYTTDVSEFLSEICSPDILILFFFIPLSLSPAISIPSGCTPTVDCLISVTYTVLTDRVQFRVETDFAGRYLALGISNDQFMVSSPSVEPGDCSVSSGAGLALIGSVSVSVRFRAKTRLIL